MLLKKEKSAYSIQAVGHALDVLEQFHGTHDEFGFSDLCRRLKFQKNKTFRLLATLESRNFIEQNKATAGYRLGLRSLQLGQTFFKQTGLLRHSRPILESLSGKSEETSYVAILRDYQVMYLDAVESRLPVRVVSRVGKTFPFYCTEVGKAIAAGMEEKTVRDYFNDTELKRYTPQTIRGVDQLSKQLREIAACGYAVEDEELQEGVTCLGAAVRDHTKCVVGAVSISVPSVRCSTKRMNTELIPLVREAAGELSRKLGY